MKRQKYIDELIKDSWLVVNYIRCANAGNNSKLFDALIALDRADDATRDARIADLHRAYNDVSRPLSFATLSAVRRGWYPGSSSKAMTYFSIAVSILFMIVTVQITNVYNSGINYVEELRRFGSLDPEQHYGQLIRQYLAAEQEVSKPGLTTSADENLVEESYFRIDSDLYNLSLKLSHIPYEASDTINLLRFPVLGSKAIYCASNRTYTFLYKALFNKKPLWVAASDCGEINGADGQQYSNNTTTYIIELLLREWQD